MAVSVKVPALGESISSGILAKWHVADGAQVTAGQALFDLETDKITSEGTAPVDGVVSLKVAEGDEVTIDQEIASIDPTAAAKPAAKPTAKPALADTATPTAKPAAAAVHPPSVQRLAAESGIDPAQVAGSARGGRVTKGDMLQAMAKSDQSDKSDKSDRSDKSDQSDKSDKSDRSDKSDQSDKSDKSKQSDKSNKSDPGRQTRRKLTPLRRTIAQRLVHAQQTTAMLTTFNEVDMAPVMELRKKHQDAFVAKHGIKLGFMSFFTRAVVHALQAVPAINAQLDGDTLIENHYYDIGVAVSTPKGLMVPVIRDCDRLGFAGIERAIIGYANKARDGKLAIEDLQGGVFTITNGGIFGSMLSTPILNTPQAAILGMHAIQERPVARNGEVVIRPMMYLALSYDHRIVDGREAVTFLVRIKEALEDPARLLLDI
jgi:2-oxoglutarate dehydrogenase E2 component (dihydrolipoamide succinyltransferase)